MYRWRMAAETPKETESRLARRDRDRTRRANQVCISFMLTVYITRKERDTTSNITNFCELRIDDENVVQMISNFHKEVAALEVVNCSVFHEAFQP